jgi:hypothetical protein
MIHARNFNCELLMPFITKEGLRQLDNYKYVSGGYSWLDNQINPYWEWSVKQLPLVRIF